MSDAWLGFFGGLLAALIGGFIASVMQRQNEERRRLEEAHLSVYLLLLELNSQYFWVASRQLHGEDPSAEVLAACRATAWKLADRLRTFDRVQHLDEILEVLFSATIPSANERARKLYTLLEKYGLRVNPKYSKHIAQVSRSNIMALGSGQEHKSYAPGLWQ